VADSGTFFLDEIGDMSPALQVKLLRVLQEGTFTAVGDTEPRHVDVRIIAATNRDLKKMVDRGEFREDLYYRINVINLHMPPLRERRDDVALLIDHFLKRHAKGSRIRMKRLSRGCLERMLDYPWPGNVRELENEIERLVVLASEERVIGEEILSPRIRQQSASGAAVPIASPFSLPAAVVALERTMIHEALRRSGGNKTRAAAELRISRRNLIRLVQKYQLEERRS
jgi:transcriptional regulator with PAS, ATPase and Fis domain